MVEHARSGVSLQTFKELEVDASQLNRLGETGQAPSLLLGNFHRRPVVSIFFFLTTQVLVGEGNFAFTSAQVLANG